MEATCETEKAREEKRFSNSSITTFLKCPRQFYFRYVKNYEAKTKSIKLIFGTAVHEAVAALYKQDTDRVRNIIAGYPVVPNEPIRTGQKLQKVVEEYQRQKFPVPWDRTLSVEEELTFYAGPYKFVVIPDVVVEWNGGIYGIEHKTTTNLRENFFASFGRDSQIDAQMLGIKERFGRCDGIYVNAIICRKGGPTAKKSEVEFIMDLVTRTEEQLERSRNYFEEHAEATEQYIASNYWPENRTSCFDYNESCLFCPLCDGRIDDPDEYYGRREKRSEQVKGESE